MAIIVLILILLLLFPILRYPLTTTMAIPSTAKHTRLVHEFLKKQPVSNVIELGSGWGGFILNAPSKHRYLGLELSPLVYWCSKWRGRNKTHITYKLKDAFNYKLENIDIVIVFVSKEFNERVVKNIPSGTMIISSYFTFEDVVLMEMLTNQLYVYRKS